jgi:hypothetical protein
MIEITLNDFQNIEDKKEAKQVLKKIADQNSDREIADHWGISIPHVRKMRADMGIKKRAGTGNGRKRTKKQTKATDVSAGSLDYNLSIEGTLTGKMLHERLDELKSLLSAMPGELFEVKIHSAHN